ncbi:hypothetical protein HDU84_009068 [Entophlyctis sp. JEL0112]|nr:hypothetical protein HDU84_009068 [Entophlyctis sp. JEL0112]
MKTNTLFVALAAAVVAPFASADTNSTAVSLVNETISVLPTCGQTCITKLPNYASPVTIDVIDAICGNLQANINSFESPLCVTFCILAAASEIELNQVGDVPQACKLLGFNESGVTFPTAIVAATTSATKTGGATIVQVTSYLVAASAVAFAYMF